MAIEGESFALPWSEGSMLREIYGGDALVFAAREGDGVLGFSVLRLIGDEGELLQIAVARRARRRGIASELLRETLAGAAERGVRRVFLEVRASNDGARALYAARGFNEVGRRRRYYDAPVEDAVVMAIDIA
jgi:ribosomal-protein-alanine N-acetyltransferase